MTNRKYTQPNQRVGEAEKKTANWYIRNAEYIISSAVGQDNKSKTRQFLNAANSIIDPSEYEHIITYYKDNGLSAKALLGKIRNMDLISPIKEKYMGEFINMFDNYQVYNNDTDIMLARNAAIRSKVMSIITQKVIHELNQKGVDVGAEADNIDFEKAIKDAADQWNDDNVVEAQHRLNLLNTLIDAKVKYIQAYFYWFACEEVYSYRTILNDDVYVEIISPLEYHRINAGARYVEDDPAGVRKYTMNIVDLLAKFESILKPSDVRYLRSVYKLDSVSNFTSNVDILPEYTTRCAIFGESFIPTTPDNKTTAMIDVYHYVWKTDVKVGILKYYGADGFENEMEVDDTYEFDESKGDISIEWKYKNEVWEGYRFGAEGLGIYTVPSIIPVQRESFNNDGMCKLPYNGMCGMLFDNYRNPIPYRLLDHQILYQIYTLQQERAVNKYKSWLLFPESIVSDSPDMTFEERIEVSNRDSTLLFNDADAGANALQSIREVANNALITYIQMLDGLKQSIRNEVNEMASMNDTRYGHIDPKQGKAVTEYAYNNAKMGTVLHIEIFNRFRERDYIANLDYSLVAWFDGKQGSYINPNTGVLETVKLSGKDALCNNIGIYIRNNSEVEAQLQALQSMAFNMSQNGNGEFALEAVTNTNVIDLKSKLKDVIQKERELALQMEQVKAEHEAQSSQLRMQEESFKHQNAVELQTIKSNSEIEVARIEAEAKLADTELRLQVDRDGNNYISEDEINARQTVASTPLSY